MARLHGFLDLLGMRLGFLLPVFSEATAHNHLVAQQVATDGTVHGFVKVEHEGRCGAPVPCREEVEVRVGDDAWWAFGVEGDVVHGSASTIDPTLRALVASGRLDPFPMTKVEVAVLCRDDGLLDAAIREAYPSLRSTSAWGARVWRDATILLPRVRRAADGWWRSIGAPASPEELGDMVVSGDDVEVRIGLPARMASRRVDRRALDDVLTASVSALLPCFGVRRVATFVRRDPATTIRRPEPRGLVRGLGAIGLEVLGAKGAEAIATPGRAISKTESSSSDAAPSFGFLVLPRLRGRLDEASTAAEGWRRSGLVTVAIVVEAPGASVAPAGRVAEAAGLQQAFDYVVHVANHHLEASAGNSPGSQARRRAASFARAAVTCFLDLAVALRASDRAAFLARVPSQGFVLVGRSGLRDGVSPSEAARAALASMVHPDLPLSSARVVYLALPDGVGLRSIDPDGSHPRLVRMTRAAGGRPGVRAIAFGVVPDPGPQHLRFARFCRSLLESRGWHLDPSSGVAADAPFVARRNGRVAVFAAAEPGCADDALMALLGHEAEDGTVGPKCLLTPRPTHFEPSTVGRSLNVSVVACHELSQWEASAGFGSWENRSFG